MKASTLQFSSFGGEVRTTSSGGLNYRVCPVCRSDKWKVYVNPQKGVWMCFAGMHYAGGKVVGVGVGAGEQDLNEMMSRLDSKPVPPEARPPIDLPISRPLEKYDYGILLERYHLRTPDKFLIRNMAMPEIGDDGQEFMEPRLLIPYYDAERQPIYFSARRKYDIGIRAGIQKYMNSTGQRALYVPFYSPYYTGDLMKSVLFITEGPFDAMRIVEEGCAAVALGGKNLPSSIRNDLLTIGAGYAIIIILLDTDAPNDAYELYIELLNLFPPTTIIRIGELPGAKDAASLKPDELRKAMLMLTKDSILDSTEGSTPESSICSRDAGIHSDG
jgi:hypothetical protein